MIEMGNKLCHYVDIDRLNQNSIIVDAGSGRGQFIDEIRKFHETQTTLIHTIECNKTNVNFIKELNIPNVIVHEFALVGRNIESVEFTEMLGSDGKYHQWGNIMGFSDREKRVKNSQQFKKIEKYIVKAVHINDIFDVLGVNKIDYLKMDIEGAEEEILLNIDQSVADRILQISLEYHENTTPSILVNCLERLGYKDIIVNTKTEEIYGAK